MLQNLISKSDIIEVDGKIVLHWDLHPVNGFECMTHSQTDAGTEYFYKIKNEEINSATLVGEHWVVCYIHDGEHHKAKIQLFKKRLIKE